MPAWVRFERDGRVGFGTLDGDTIRVFEGDLFDHPSATQNTVPLDGASLLMPCVPSKLVGLWNNFHALAEKQGNAIPAEPLYFLKGASSYLGPGQSIRRPARYEGRVVYEGELGIVIGRHSYDVDEGAADAAIFGYTCVNDVTALDILERDASFAQWVRAKSFDTFGVFGPAIVTGIDPSGLTVRTLINGKERQSYPVSDMIFPPRALVSLISREMTLLPGDLIACGTSVGVGALRSGSTVEVVIDGIGTLSNPVA